MKSLVTVAICTHNRAKYLDACLAALAKSMKGHRIPTLIVANCCNDHTEEVAAGYRGILDLWVVKEDRLGLSNARNCALENVESSYIVFLDDDAMPLPSWCDAIDRIVKCVKPDIFGGPYYPYYLESKPGWFVDDFGSAHVASVDGFMTPGDYLSGGNMGWRLDLLKRIGGFDPDLGMRGSKLSLGEETAIQVRLERDDRIMRYFATDMCMLHYVSPGKMRLAYIAKRSFVYGYLLAEINPNDWCLKNVGLMRLVRDTKLGLPLVFRLFARDRSKYHYWKTYAAKYLSLHMITVGVLARKVMSASSFMWRVR